MSRAQLTSTVEQNTGGAVAPWMAGKNFVANGNYDIAQRGTSFTNTGNGTYTLDRWTTASSSSTSTVSQQSTGVPVGSRYNIRVTYGAASSYYNLHQFIETANVAPLWGQTVTFSVKMRRNSSLATNFNLTIYKSATVDAGTSASWTSIAGTTVANSSLPTGTGSANWYTATVTATIPNDGTANTLRVGVEEISAGVSGAYYEVAQAQLEIGAVATPFARAGGTLQGELALCQRYYYRVGGSNTNETFGVGLNKQSTTNLVIVNLPVQMRVAPTSLDFANLQISDNYTYGTSITACALFNNGNSKDSPLVEGTVSGGLTTGQMSFIRSAATTNGYLGFSAEL